MDNIDFERAVARKLELNKFMKYSPQTLEPGRNASSSRLQWNFKMLDLVVGRGTTANTIMVDMLRDLKFRNNTTPEKKYKRAEVVVKISDSKGGWYGNKRSPKKL